MTRPRQGGGSWLLEGLCAAAVGLGSVAAVVLLLWTTTPHADGGPRAALGVAADLWLLAHGVTLLRTETLHGLPAPVGLAPLLLTALPAWLLYRAVRVAGRPAGDGARTAVGPWQAPRAAGWIVAGYLLVGAAAVAYADDGPLRPDPLSAAVRLPLFAVAATAVGVCRSSGPAALDRCRPLREGVLWAEQTGALRAAVAATAALCCAGALLAAAAAVCHADVAREVAGRLTDGWSGRVALVLLCVALAPNAAVWAAAFGLGPGFTAGAPVVAPLFTASTPGVPEMPAAWTVAVWTVPLAGAVAGAWCGARGAVPVRGDRATAVGWRDAALGMVLAAAGTGLAMAALAALSAGSLGVGRLAALGPQWWLTGLAAAGWTALLGVPALLVLRAARLRRPGRAARGTPRARGGGNGRAAAPGATRAAAGEDDPVDAWHSSAARKARWAALKHASGGLVPPLPPDGVPGAEGQVSRPDRRSAPATRAADPRTPAGRAR